MALETGAAAGRLTQSLDGLWDFTHAADGLKRQARVPMPWQAQFPDLRMSSGVALYARSFRLEPGFAGKSLFLCFGAVSYSAKVSLNGTELGTHEGGWLPFEFALPAALLLPENRIEVVCYLPDGSPITPPEGLEALSFAEIPHGKQSWYGPTGGIWQTVRIEARPLRHLRHAAITADPETGSVLARLEASEPGPANVSILGPDGRVLASLAADSGAPVSLRVAAPELWSPDSPSLYRLRVDLGEDATEHVFGFRSIRTEGGKVLLNGKPFYMRGALDQDFYPEGISTPPSLGFLEDQLRKAKELGLNTLRCHIKVPDPRYYEVADRLGMLIWTEIPNVAQFSPEAGQRMREVMEGILRRDGNHPSIAIWTIINEDWGTRLVEDASHRAWLKAEYDWLKAADPTRLVVDNSPCVPNFHVKTDLNDYHYYRAIPERRAEWDALTEEFAAGADWTFSPHGDAERRGDEPLIVSEFGVWGLPQPAEIRLGNAEPWWTETGQGWGDGAAYPHGIEERYRLLQLETVFGPLASFVEAAQWHQFRSLKYQIETMRGAASIQGYVITELTDVHWESNGLLDMNRNPRVFHSAFAAVNGEVAIVPRLDRYAFWAQREVSIPVAVAAGGAEVPPCVLQYRSAGGSGHLPVQGVAAASVADLGAIALTFPETGENRREVIELVLEAGGQIIASNRIEVSVYAPVVAAGAVDVPDPVLADWFRAQGYEVAAGAGLTIVKALDQDDITRMQGGARYLVLADGSVPTQGNLRSDEAPRDPPALPWEDGRNGLPGTPDLSLPQIGLAARHGTIWRGDWIANFSWLRRDGAFAALPGGPMLDESFDRVVPQHVLTGMRAWEFGGPVQAGLVVGWVHKPAATILRRKVGNGGLIATTFRLDTEAAGVDPVAAALTRALIAEAR